MRCLPPARLIACLAMACAGFLPVAGSCAESTAPAAGAAQAVPGVAFIVDLKGESRLSGKRAQLMAELQPGQTLAVAAEGHLVIMFIKNGHEFSLASGDYVMQPDQIQVAKGGRGKVTRRTTAWRPDPGTLINVSRTATASLRMRSLGNPPHDPDRLRLIGPDATVVTSVSPTLTWQVAPGTRAAVKLESAGKVVQETSTEALSWKPAQRLEAGKTYRWTVSAGREEKSAEFSVLDAAGQKQLALLPHGSAFSDRLMRAVTLQTLGALGEAKALFGELAAERPDLPELASLAR